MGRKYKYSIMVKNNRYAVCVKSNVHCLLLTKFVSDQMTGEWNVACEKRFFYISVQFTHLPFWSILNKFVND